MHLFTPHKAPPRPQIDLNPEQREAVDALDRFVRDPDARFFGLFGAAGTGKTSVISYLFECERAEEFDRVCLSAPTHKATGVLAEKAGFYIDCRTIHKLLGCRKHYDEDNGEIEFLPDPDREMIGSYEIVAVDECSMIGDRLYGWIVEAAKRNGVKIVWLGDPYQLPPVKDGDKSPTFAVSASMELKTIMRHKGVIQNACDAVRRSIIEGTRPPIARPASDNHGEIVQIRNSEEGIERFFSEFMRDPKGSKALAFKNDHVDFMNGYVRAMLYGEDPPPFVPSERLVFAETYEPEHGPMMHTGNECSVVDVAEDTRLGLECFRLYLESDFGERLEAFAFGTKHQRRAYAKKLADAREDGKAGQGWKPYFRLKETFARLRPGYATTIHKSQGSTYRRVFLLQSEMLGLYDKSLLARLAYVAYSRAQSALYLV